MAATEQEEQCPARPGNGSFASAADASRFCAQTGLRGEEAAARLYRYGPNRIEKVAGRSRFLFFLAHFTHLMALLLWLGGIVAFGAGLPQLAIAIWSVNLINGLFGFWQEYKAERAVEALRRLLPIHARVVRDGRAVRIDAAGVVPGDILLLTAGDPIPADGRLLQAQQLQIDESTLTGESRPVGKWPQPAAPDGTPGGRSGRVFAGTHALGGQGTVLVEATGMATEFGRIAALTQGVGKERSPLQREIGHVTKMVTALAVAAGLFFFVLATLLIGMDLARGFIFAMGMIVAFVPEGLLPTVTLALAMGVQRMARRQALVKQLASVETLGRTTVICTDKTGTLTRNEMTVRALWCGGRRFTVSGEGYAPRGTISVAGQPLATLPDDLRPLLLVAALCNNARLLPPTAGVPDWRLEGDPTEGALLAAAAKGGLDVAAEAERAPRLQEIPFAAVRRRMCTLHRCGETRRSFLKGATHEILAHCRSWLRDGREEELSEPLRATIIAAMEEYARQGLRVLAMAWGVLPAGAEAWVERLEADLVFLGLMAMEDPPRPEVAVAVANCHRAGIRLIMISGDYGLTAAAIARQIGLVRQQARICTGSELNAMDDEALRELLGAGEVILARVAPEHKLRVVTTLQQMGEVVAMTGDGVNDAPALKRADIGVAMGRTGTEVAREAADMILLDDNFASIVAAVEEGRGVYDNIRKFTSYIFTSNTPEAVPFILYAFSGGGVPLALNIMQILSVDLGTDLVPALALGRETPESGTMARAPRRLGEHIIDRRLLTRAYLWLGPLQALAAMTAFYFHFWTHGYWGRWIDLPADSPLYAAATSMALAAVVVTQIGNLFAHRSETVRLHCLNWRSNPLVWVGIVTELAVLAAILYLPPLQKIFGTAPFPPLGWLFLLAWLPVLPLADEARKALRARQRR